MMTYMLIDILTCFHLCYSNNRVLMALKKRSVESLGTAPSKLSVNLLEPQLVTCCIQVAGFIITKSHLFYFVSFALIVEYT